MKNTQYVAVAVVDEAVHTIVTDDYDKARSTPGVIRIMQVNTLERSTAHITVCNYWNVYPDGETTGPYQTMHAANFAATCARTHVMVANLTTRETLLEKAVNLR